MFERTKNINLSVIKQIELKASKYPDVVSLAQGIPGFDTPHYIKRRAENALKRGVVGKYSLSPGLPELREMIEMSLQKENMFYDWEKEIVVTAGAIEAMTASVMATTNPGEEVIIIDPTYTSYKEVVRLAGCIPVFVSLNKNEGWSFQLEEFEKAITEKTKAIFYCNPNNPTGTVYSKEELLQLAALAEKHNLFLISDEVYKDFIFTEEKFFSLAEVPELRKRVIRIYSFSKAFAMTGWRIGCLHSDESVVKEILKVHDSLVTCAPVISQYGAMGALETAEEEVSAFGREYAQRRDMVCKELDEMGELFSYTKPEGAYYVFPEVNPQNKKIKELGMVGDKGKVDCWKFAMYLLEKLQVAFVPGIAFGAQGEGHLRINFGRETKDIKEAFKRIRKEFAT